MLIFRLFLSPVSGICSLVGTQKFLTINERYLTEKWFVYLHQSSVILKTFNKLL